MRRFRASAMPMAFLCPGSIRPSTVEIQPASPPADQGTAGHDVMKRIVDADATSLEGIDVPAIALLHDADPDELRIQAHIGLQVWQELRGMFPRAQAEVALRARVGLGGDDHALLTGHVDVLTVDRPRRVAHIADWKFGRVDGNHRHQVMAYAALVLLTYPEVDRVVCFVVWMREGEVETYSMDRDAMQGWFDDLRAEVIDWDGVYHPSPGCEHCRRTHDCPAMAAMVRRDVEIFGERGMAARIEAGLADLTGPEVVQLRRRAKLVEKVIESLDRAVRARVDAAGGAIPDGEGRELRFISQDRKEVDPLKGTPVLERWLTDEELAGCIKISLSSANDAVADKTERGQKGKQIAAMNEELRAAGALIVTKIRRLQDVKLKGGTDGQPE